ncbi:thiopeptide maturation pyridine synthase [Nonomuraea sp. NPDC049158]|uniref:thiopeptide maturation pyridine synthase n=1 Tax=Nonomuraea sp. NPDC049158 TaxID=3155649 RepID=UPI00340D79F2
MTPLQPSRWHSVHIAYHDVPGQDDLLLDAVGPLLRRVSGIVEAAHVLRHWRRGPHLRLNVKTDPATWADAVRQAIDEVIGSYLRVHPSTVVLDQRGLLAQHRVLAEQEKDPGPLTPWYPDNSLHYAPYDPRHQALDEDAADLLADFYTDSTPLLLDMLRHVRLGHDTKDGLAMALMLATSHTALGPITRSFVSYRSHAEGFLARCADPNAMRARFERDYQAQRDELTGRVRAVIATLDGTTSTDCTTGTDSTAAGTDRTDSTAGTGHTTTGTDATACTAGITGITGIPVLFVREWAALVAEYGRRAEPLIARGRLIRPGSHQEALAIPRLSDFHRLMFSSRTYHDRVFADPDFLRYRVLINYTYLQNTRLGITPPARFRICHLAANAVEEVYDLSALGLIRAFVEAHP